MLQAQYSGIPFPNSNIDSVAFRIHRSFPHLLLATGSFVHYIKTFITAGELKNTWGRGMNWKEQSTYNLRAFNQIMYLSVLF
jgi:hypothetical protein